MSVLIVVLVIIAIVAFILISSQRKLVSFDELCQNALSQIGVQLSSRWDALSSLAKLTKSYSEHEYKTLTDIIAHRSTITPASSASDVESQEDLISSVSSRIMAIAESYPNLKSDQVYISTMGSLNRYEEQVRMSRMVYNDSVTKFNREVRQFPTNIAASIFGFASRDYLEKDESKADMPDMAI